MPISRIILTLTVLVTLPLSAYALGSSSDTEAELKALIVAAEKSVAATDAWQKANSSDRQRLTEEAVRRSIISTVQSGYDAKQMEVDRKIDELLDISLSKTSDKLITPAQKERIKELFKEEQYKYMYEKTSSRIEDPYDSVRGTDLRITFLMSQSLRGDKILEKEIGDILENINRRMGGVGVIRPSGIEDLKQEIFKQFNLLN